MKATGHDIVAFFNSEWPTGYYVDDSELTADENSIFAYDSENNKLPLEDKYDLNKFGFLCSDSGERTPSLETFFKKWKAEQTHIILSVSIPKEDEQAVREYLSTIPTAKVV